MRMKEAKFPLFAAVHANREASRQMFEGRAIDAVLTRGELLVSVTIAGKPLGSSATYTLAANGDMPGGGGDALLKSAKSRFGVLAAKLMANGVMVCIAAKGSVAAKVEGRMKLAI